MPCRGLKGFINSVFKRVPLSLLYPHYSCISKRVKTVNITFNMQTKGAIQHVSLDSKGAGD
ncbi:Mobile element protein [Candidatus Enterovibrio altilux]|uniref:Mobile element protein n=2 Tax=Candidatus Enterovibrio altilux TaxID=1927128 RepID=A0A291B9Z2_9GAMM|nr:Mobile element protein [Candidatus Enterovibrio luxaltus]